MSEQDKSDAEKWIESAIITLGYMPHDDTHLRELTGAIESYCLGDYGVAGAAACSLVKPSKNRRFPQHLIPRPKSLDELKRQFREACVGVQPTNVTGRISGEPNDGLTDSD